MNLLIEHPKNLLGMAKEGIIKMPEIFTLFVLGVLLPLGFLFGIYCILKDRG